MALIKCSECGKEVSTQATACPHCGCPIAVVLKDAARPSEPQPAPKSPEELDAKSQKREAQQEMAPTPDPGPGTGSKPFDQGAKQPGINKGCLGCLGIIILCVMVGWIADMADCNQTSQQSVTPAAPNRISKQEWRQKVRPYWNPGGGMKVTSIADFKALVGEPSQTQTVEGHAYWYYECSDGTIQVELVDPNLSQGRMLITAINDF
jgi:hypothetical protein